jgi:hypothetical protein
MWYVLFLFCFLCGSVNGTNASPWNRQKGESSHFFTARTYATDSYFDINGKKHAKGGNFTKYEAQYYAEYGVTPAWTVGYNLFASHQRDSSPSRASIIELRGLTRADLFARYQLYRDDTYAIALQPSLTLPPYYTTQKIADAVLYDQPAAEAAMLVGRNFLFYGKSHWLSAKAAYRHRGGALDDQYIVEAQAGIRLTDALSFIPEWSHIHAASPITVPLRTIAGDNNYTLTKLHASLAYQLTSALTLQAGAFQHVAGVNAGAGGGGLFSLWIQL